MAIVGGGETAARPKAASPAAAPSVAFLPADQAERLAPEWADLAAHASEPNPYGESWFVRASLRHLARSEVRLGEVRDGGTLLGLVPLLIEPRYGRVPVRHVQNWCHHHHFLGTPLVRAGHEQAFWRALILALDDAQWAPGFLHIRGITEGGPVQLGLQQAAGSLSREAALVHRETRAFLHSDRSPQDYYEQAVRKKKRKEIARLQNRLGELGPVFARTLQNADELEAWCDDFLQLEFRGWKGEAKSALACRPATEAFFREAVAGAHEAGRLQFLRLDLVERPLAMLVNFLTPPGSFSFKTAFDEDFARFSPGVLLQIENLKILERSDIDWMDSCASEQHPMIDSLWRERRSVVRMTVPLAGARRRASFLAARFLEQASAARRRLVSRRATPAGDAE